MTEPRWIKLSDDKPNFINKRFYLFADHESVHYREYIPDWATHWREIDLPEEEKPVDLERMKIEGRTFEVYHAKDVVFYECHFDSNDVDVVDMLRKGGLVFVEKEKPLDPDWEAFEKSFKKWDRNLSCDTYLLDDIYQFLKAKYGKM